MFETIVGEITVSPPKRWTLKDHLGGRVDTTITTVIISITIINITGLDGRGARDLVLDALHLAGGSTYK